MVPGSTLMYGSSFIIVTRRPRASRIAASDAAVIPLPSEDTTPPVTKIRGVTGLLGVMAAAARWKAPFYRSRRRGAAAPPGRRGRGDAGGAIRDNARMSTRYDAADIEVLSGLDP